MVAPRPRDAALLSALRRRLDGADPVALTNFAWFAARIGQVAPALDAARRAAALPGAPRAAWRALERLAIGRTDGLVLATVLAESSPRNEHLASPLAAAVAAHRQEAHAVAEACYHAASADPALAAAAWNGLAVLHEQREERVAADQAWQRSLVHPRAATVHNRALAFLRRGEAQAGRELLAAHAELVGGSAPLLFLMGYTALLAGDAPLARLSIERALALEPDLARAQFTLGLVHERLGRPADALAATRRGLLMSPWYLPQVWLLEPQPGGPLTELAAAEDPSTAGGQAEAVLLALGRSLLEAGHLGESLAVFDQVLLRHPSHTSALFHRGVVLAKLRRYQEALEDWHLVEQADPTHDLAAATRRHAESARRLATLFATG
jgi:tetratricopeptide (TPR) repeat protein